MRGTHDHDSWTDAEAGRTRVLIECPSSASPSIIADLVQRSGFDVRTCVGPEGRHECELVDRGTCGLVAGADVVVNMLGVRRPAGRDVAAAVLSERRPPELIVEVAQPSLPVEGLDLSSAEVVGTPVRAPELLDAITSVVDRRARPAAWWGDGVP